MGPFSGPVSIMVLLSLIKVMSASVDAQSEKFEPMVAFMCNKPAMHKVLNRWEYDMSTDCLAKKTDILKYCQQLYPDHQITNIVEASHQESIGGWPDRMRPETRHSHRVRPFRCIVGPFQSDALLVPQHCVFDHHHDTSQCLTFDRWNLTAVEMCKGKKMKTESFAMLLDCGVDQFNGVEFVCCPKGKTTHSHPIHLEVDEKSQEEDEDTPAIGKTMGANKPHAHGDAFHDYLQSIKSDYRNEHEWYLAARKAMKKDEQAKITNLMKEWQAAREHVATMKKTDPKRAMILGHEVTQRFQRLYKEFDQEDIVEKKQIVALHQQHIQGDLNKRKRVAMEKYMNALQERDAQKVLKYLRAYYRAEQKDKMHTVNHYQHVKYTAPEELPRIRPHYREHIKLINQRLEQSLQMLQRYPEIEETVKPEMEKFALRYKAVDASAFNVILNDNEEEVSSESKPVEESSESDKTPSSYDSETHEDEHAYEHENQFVAHVVNGGMNVDDRALQEVEIHGITHEVGSTFGIAIGSVAVFVIIVVAIVMLRRNRSQPPVTHGYVEVDPAASPEERHVANMQMNGYENPTYRYFELSPPAKK